MRILLQENSYKFGIVDLPYEMCALSMGYAGDKSKFYIYVHFNRVKEQKIAEYSTEAKVRKAMEMLHEEYAFEKQFETICNGTTDYPSKPTYFFQMPADDEVEV